MEGGGPKYERLTDVPTDAGAGNKLQPGPGPIGPGPGPCRRRAGSAAFDPDRSWQAFVMGSE